MTEHFRPFYQWYFTLFRQLFEFYCNKKNYKKTNSKGERETTFSKQANITDMIEITKKKGNSENLQKPDIETAA